jgi:hypothetical protein
MTNNASADMREDKVAGVGMHIMLDEHSQPPRIKILNIAEWSPLEAHVRPGDTLEAIDRVPCNTITFEQVGMLTCSADSGLKQ